MAANITEFVDITVNVAAASPDRFSFGNMMGVFEHNITTDRQNGPYASVAEVEAAGFTSGAAPSVNFWANSVFAQDDAVDSILIGRKIPAAGGPWDRVWQVDATGPAFVNMTTEANDATVNNWVIFPAVEGDGDYAALGSPVPFASVTFNAAGGTAGVDGGTNVLVWQYWNGSTWAALAGVVDGTTAFTAGATDGQVLTFTQPADWAPTELNSSGGQLYYIRAFLSTADYATNPIYDDAVITADTSWANALSAIAAVAGDDSWYGHTIDTRVEADILGVASWTESRFHFFISQSADEAYLSGTAGNVGEDMEAAGYKRSAGPLYHATSSGSANAYADGAWASSGFGMDLDAPNGRGIWAYRVLEGITFDNITSGQANNIYAVNGNIYGRNKGLSFTSKGTTAFGSPYFIDIQTTIDWIKVRLEEDVLALFVAQNVVPYTNAGIQLIVSTVKNRLDQGVTFGHFSGDPGNEPTVTAPDVTEISSQDKQDRVLTLTATAVFAGAIQKLTLVVNLSF